MADDWIKMRKCLYDHPKVAYIARHSGMSDPQVVGWLGKIWSWADTHTEDGCVRFLSMQDVTRITLAPEKFVASMRQVGWIIESADGISFPEFDAHMSESAKKRAVEAKRKRDKRASAKRPQNVRKKTDQRREEKTLVSKKVSKKGILIDPKEMTDVKLAEGLFDRLVSDGTFPDDSGESQLTFLSAWLAAGRGKQPAALLSSMLRDGNYDFVTEDDMDTARRMISV